MLQHIASQAQVHCQGMVVCESCGCMPHLWQLLCTDSCPAVRLISAWVGSQLAKHFRPAHQWIAELDLRVAGRGITSTISEKR